MKNHEKRRILENPRCVPGVFLLKLNLKPTCLWVTFGDHGRRQLTLKKQFLITDIPSGSVSACRFDIDTPFIVNRHVSEHAVVPRGRLPSELSYCEFFGGQGCLNFMGENSSIHHNLFVNKQTVTNHYCVMACGDGSKVFINRFEPEIGSWLEIFRHRNIDVFDNYFHIEACLPPASTDKRKTAPPPSV